MNRVILFRGKRIDTGEWVKGLPFSLHATSSIEGIETYDGERHKVDPSTVCEYTGLIDKNWNKIWEGDIMDFYAFGLHYIGVVTFDNACFVIKGKNKNKGVFLDVAIDRHDSVCVGNLYDNPELMEGD